MDKIYIPQLLHAPEHTETIRVHQSVPGFQTLTPVQGHLTVTHCGQYLDVAASVETITTLTCDRCLQNYNHRLTVDASELIWLDHAPTVEDDVLDEDIIADDLVETLSSTGYFDPETWLYEYLCLSLPPQKLCDQNCPGIQIDDSNETENDAVDSRWGALATLKAQLKNQ
ncbi:MAG: YceD family protein [Leptolyngbyaceae bacterium]|nr:YceD family protein [Leptolyngbyaceae bacterium]